MLKNRQRSTQRVYQRKYEKILKYTLNTLGIIAFTVIVDISLYLWLSGRTCAVSIVVATLVIVVFFLIVTFGPRGHQQHEGKPSTDDHNLEYGMRPGTDALFGNWRKATPPDRKALWILIKSGELTERQIDIVFDLYWVKLSPLYIALKHSMMDHQVEDFDEDIRERVRKICAARRG